MDWLKPSLFVVLLVSVLVTECCGHNSSYFEVVQRYEQCVLNRLPRSPIFEEEDRLHMVKVANEVNHRMHLLHLDPTNAPHARSMLRLFASALANVVAYSEVPESPQRKDAYIAVIETCARSLPRPVAEKLVQDVKRIISSTGNEKFDGNKTPVLSRRRGMPTESAGPAAPDDHISIQRSKRSPQAVAFSAFGGWQPTESLQTVLSNILLNSNAFQNVFTDGISRRNAIYYARSMVEAGLVNYHFSVVQDVVKSVSNAISTFPFTPESGDYAFAISSSIVSVLDARQLSFFADGVGIGNGLVSKLQTMLGNAAPAASFPIGSDSSASSFSWGTSSGSIPSSQRMVGNKAPAASFPIGSDSSASSFSWGTSGSSIPSPQRMVGNKAPAASFPIGSDSSASSFSWETSSGSIPSQQRTVSSSQMSSGFVQSQQQQQPTVFSSSQSDADDFQSNLAFFLYQSNKIQDAFCNGPVQGIFDMVNEGLSEYGLSISITAASIINDSLTSMTSDLACAQFGNVISETVTSILKDNNLLQSANAQDIAEKMALNINPRQDFEEPPTQNQKDFSPPEYSDSQQEPPFFSEFSFPQPQQPALNPDYQSEPPQYPNFGMLPDNPMIKTEDYPETEEFSFEPSDSAQIPAQRTQMSEEYPQFNPGSESAVPGDYTGDAPKTSGTDISSAQRASSDSRTDESGGEKFESSEGSGIMSNPQISSYASAPLDSGIPPETDKQNTPGTMEISQSKASAESGSNGTPTTLSLNRTVYAENGDTRTRTTVNIITTTTPYPYSTTSLDGGKVAKIVLDDIYASLRALNSSSDDDAKSETDSPDVEKKDYSADSESSTIQNAPLTDKVESDETKLTTVAAAEESSRTKQETTVYLEPSFWSTSSPGTSEGSSVVGLKNETQRSDDVPEEELQLRDPTLVFAEHVAAIATSTINFIRSGDVNLQDLCNKVNDLAPVVDIPPLDVCNSVAMVDYLLNVLKTVTFILRSV